MHGEAVGPQLLSVPGTGYVAFAKGLHPSEPGPLPGELRWFLVLGTVQQVVQSVNQDCPRSAWQRKQGARGKPAPGARQSPLPSSWGLKEVKSSRGHGSNAAPGTSQTLKPRPR